MGGISDPAVSDLQDSAVHDELFLISAERVCYGSDVYDSAWNDSGYAGYFVLGHYLSHYEIPKKMEKTVYILGVVLIITAILLCQIMSPREGREIQAYYENFTLAGFFWGSAVFLFFKNYVSRIQWTEKQEEVICRLGSYTFGIYLIHAFFRDILHRAGVDSMMIGITFIAIPMVMICIFVLSCIGVILIKKIPVLGKWIV